MKKKTNLCKAKTTDNRKCQHKATLFGLCMVHYIRDVYNGTKTNPQDKYPSKQGLKRI